MLGGFRALDLTDEKGFMCGKMLADLGVDVIKIEKPGGDHSRNFPPFANDIPDPERSLYWMAFNTGKRGITLDIEGPDGRDILKRLVKTADFVIESFPPGYLNGLGLGYSALSEVQPRVIMTSITPFGQTGPYRDYKGSDITTMAMGSLMAMTGDPDRAPLRMALDQAYSLAGLYAVAGSVIAHYHREISGEGQHVDISMQECILDANYWDTIRWELAGTVTKRAGSRHPRAKGATSMIWACKDGYVTWFVLGGPQGAEEIGALKQWMEEEGVSAGPLEKVDWKNLQLSRLSQDEIRSVEQSIGAFFKRHTGKELVDGGIKRRIKITKINSIEDVLKDEQLHSRGYWTKLEHPSLSMPISYPNHFFLSNKFKFATPRRAPFIGEHNQEIYENELSYSHEEIGRLRRLNVI